MQVSIELPAEPLWVDGDPVRLTQMIANLINNAAKFTPEGGQIRIIGERRGDEVHVRIRDTGIGIPPEHLTNVFELFQQVHGVSNARSGGLGIGLTLVRQFAELHGGSVQAISEGPGKGAEFVIRLPSLRDAAGTSRRPDGMSRSSR
jgi:signal transduction histidine kinase